MTVQCQHQDCEQPATHRGVHASSDCLVDVCATHNDEITRDGHWVPGFEGRPVDGTRFRLTRSSNPSGEDGDGNPSAPYIPGAEVVKLAEYAWPGVVQYIHVSTLEELLALVDEHGRVIVHDKNYGDADPNIEPVRTLELYDGYRE